MTRDRKSFIMDTVFPMILIVIGLYLTQVEFLSDDYPKRMLSPEGFPKGQPLIYN
jgi:hypothetical protein